MEEDSFASWMRHVICLDDNYDSQRPPTYNFYKMGLENNNMVYNLADMLTLTAAALLVIPAVTVIRMFLPTNTVL